jgi:hypothetical protein
MQKSLQFFKKVDIPYTQPRANMPKPDGQQRQKAPSSALAVIEEVPIRRY